MVLLSMLTCFFVLDFFKNLMCVWLGKTTVLFICIQKRVKSIVFALFMKFCDESGLAILNYILNTLLKSSSLALTYLTQEKKIYVSSIIQLWRSFVCKILRVLSPWEKYSVGWFLFISLICDIIFVKKF